MILPEIKLPDGFNWIAVLKDLAHGAPLSHERYRELKRMAGAWPTCACGQLCSALPRDPMGRPSDFVLSNFGLTFYHQIETGKWREALATFYKIEARTKQLLEQEEMNHIK